MSLDQYASLAEILAAIAVVCSLIYVGYQVSQNTQEICLNAFSTSIAELNAQYRLVAENGEFAELMMPKGVELLYLGNAVMTLIGGEEWDEVVVVKYPSRVSFVEMVRDPAYQEISRYRTEGLLDSRLILTKQPST